MGCGASQNFSYKCDLNPRSQNNELESISDNRREDSESQVVDLPKKLIKSEYDDVIIVQRNSILHNVSQTAGSLIKNPYNEQSNIFDSSIENTLGDKKNQSLLEISGKEANSLKSQTVRVEFENHPHEFDFSFIEENRTCNLPDIETDRILKEIIEEV
ncbi:hypothetical protein SteCoe_36520 [Stentor coeruleus]|uniref:Uncharacterized protein n=1 Tax=Stentor coeruleus TaxID=5963 RepID=A0A1R2APZ0_9CILI|nr:hypothetical protein SteCoe_36520 [Stentor coeruleus]